MASEPRFIALLCLAAACDGGAGPSSTPPGPARLQRVVSGAVHFVGTETSACSQPVPAAGEADIWCAFYRTDPVADRTELWTIKVSRAAAGTPVSCDGTDSRCIRLTSNLWTGTTIFSPAHPEIHGFDGSSLLFYADATPGGPDDPFIGPVRLWRPGWSQSRTITTAQGYVCYGHASAAVAFCLDNVVQLATNTEFDLLAGSVADPAGGPLPRLDHIRVHGSAGQILWGAAFSPAGDYLALSSPPMNVDVEVLRVAKLAGAAPTSPAQILGDAARWQISADGKKVYYIKDFGIQATRQEVDRWGSLMVADFPTGANPMELAPHVPGFLAMSASGADAGVAFLQDTVDGAGAFRVIPDWRRPQQAVTVENGVEYFEVSPDLRYAFLEEPFSRDRNPEGIAARLDGKSSCIFTVKPGYPVVHPVFVTTPRFMFWGDEVEMGAYDLEGWYADPQTCTKRRFSPRLSRLTATSDGIVYGEYAEGDRERETMTLKHPTLSSDGLPEGGGEAIAEGVDVRIALAAQRHQILFTVSRGAPEMQGLYVYGPLP